MKMKSNLTSALFGSFCLLAMTSCTLLSSCVMYKEPPPALSVEYGSYSCDGSRQFVAEFEKEGTRVAVMLDGRTRTFVRDTSGVYHDGSMTLTGSETHPITIYEGGMPIFANCVPVTTQKQYYRKDEKFRLFDYKRDLEH
ncbi:MAG: hypothetical protein DI586_04585 [Micavibrio aeruginosavorus]|uniref:C-type lysozyme inhibitor domain-containing protein n=1 Tax=Micavibrio aeruginosavorus TaxID=349221 RepID=A0A2W5HDJ5_9BACT|nr:MAG: hypothetical protein DI586_04585 [Micavibrio aeruginosavorus]